jgi:hypothetical protein
MDAVKRLEQLNEMNWNAVLESGKLEEFAAEAYSIHKQLGLSDSEYIKNEKFCDFHIDQQQVKKDKFDLVIDNIAKPRPMGIENSEIDIFEFGQESKVTDFIKKTLELKACLPAHNLQVPGKIYSTHVDYNRTFFRYLAKEQVQNNKAKDIKKFIWFLEDQAIGQFIAVGRDCLVWKAGDIVSWPWYMPHGTANASSQNRPIVMICGV